MLLSPLDELRQKWEQRPYGPNSIPCRSAMVLMRSRRNSTASTKLKPVPRGGLLQADLENLFAQLTGQVKTLEYVNPAGSRISRRRNLHGVHTSDHLARLWANDEVTRILAPHDASLTDAAITLAARYQLVTSVTGAVVLETKEQYRANGLEPVNAGTVPTIPEPEMVVLLLIAGAFMIWITYMKYCKRGRGSCTV